MTAMRLVGVVLGAGALAANVSLAGMLAPGTAFPAWELADHTGANVSSKALAGKTYLLWFYPKASTPG